MRNRLTTCAAVFALVIFSRSTAQDCTEIDLVDECCECFPDTLFLGWDPAGLSFVRITRIDASTLSIQYHATPHQAKAEIESSPCVDCPIQNTEYEVGLAQELRRHSSCHTYNLGACAGGNSILVYDNYRFGQWPECSEIWDFRDLSCCPFYDWSPAPCTDTLQVCSDLAQLSLADAPNTVGLAGSATSIPVSAYFDDDFDLQVLLLCNQNPYKYYQSFVAPITYGGLWTLVFPCQWAQDIDNIQIGQTIDASGWFLFTDWSFIGPELYTWCESRKVVCGDSAFSVVNNMNPGSGMGSCP